MLVATKLSHRAGKRRAIYLAVVRRREVRNLAIVLALFLIASCGSSGGPSRNAAPSSDDVALAARGRVALVATLTDTPYRLPRVTSLNCVNDRRSKMPRGASLEPEIYCSLNGGAMRHLLRRLNHGFGADVSAAQRSCINRKITRDQIAALLNAEIGVGADDPAAAVAGFDYQLASIIRQCTNNGA